jgi:hypothetical protein
MKLAAALLVILLAACGQAPQPTQDLRIAISPAAQPSSDALLACLPRDERVAITIDPRYPAAIDLADYDFYLRLGEPAEPASFAAQLATERVLLIINREQDLDSLTPAQAAALFSGRAENWEELGGEDEPTQLWVSPDSDEARVAFETSVLRGALAGSAHLAGDSAGVLAAVAADSGAAGILPAAWVSDAVQPIDLGLSLPLLAVANAEPQGAAREVLACMQSGAGQQVLAQTYAPLEP